MKIPGITKSDDGTVAVDSPLAKMPRIQKELTACLQCGYCISVCEAHNQTPWESVTPRGKIYYLNQISNANGMDKMMKREVSLNPYFVDAMYKCTGCGNCEEVCHAKIHLVEFWENVRKWLVDCGVGPMSAHKGMAKKVAEVHNPYGESPSKRGDWWPTDVEKAEVPDAIFFAGCTGSYREQAVPQMGVRILDRAGVKMNILGEKEWCCSSPLLRTGTHTESLACAETVVEKADMMGAKDMVMTCSGCYKTVSSDFGKFYAKAGQNVYHFSQYVEKLINAKKLPLNHEFKAKVTYHDPCHLGRHMGVFDSPRNVIKKIKGLELIEMERTRENSRCCGAGGGYKSQYNDFAVNIASERIRDAEETGAEILVTCCPFCVLNLKQGAKKIGSKIKVMDLAEILLQVTAPVEAAPAKEKPAGEPVAKATSTEVAVKAESAVVVKEPAAKPAVIPAEEKPDEAKPVANAQVETASVSADAATAASVEKAEPAAPAETPAPVEAPVADSTVVAAAIPETESEQTEEDSEEDIFTDNSPGALVRRACWNKGLRCRRDYGECLIPIAFVKSKVAVFINEDGSVDPEMSATLENDGWVVMKFKESSVTDGEEQANEIRAVAKENLKTLKKKKK